MRTRSTGSHKRDQKPHTWSYCRRPSGTCIIADEPLSNVFTGWVGKSKETVDDFPHRYPKKGTYTSSEFLTTDVESSYGGSGFRRINTDPYASCSSGNCAFEGSVVADDWGYFLPVAAGLNPLIPPTSSIDIAALRGEAYLAAVADAKSPDVQGLVFLGELQRTLGLIHDPLRELVSIVRRYRKLHERDVRRAERLAKRPRREKPKDANQRPTSDTASVRAAHRTTKDVARTHLKFIYGVKPLMMDIEGVMRALQRRQRKMQRFHRSVSDESASSTQTVYNNTVDIMTIKTDVVDHVLVKAGVAFEYANDSLAREFGFSLSQIPPSAWELIPFSFVVDWVVNVGDYIAAITPEAGVTQLGGYTTVIRNVTVRREVVNHSLEPVGWSITRACSDWDMVKFKTIHRIPETGVGKFPNFRLRLNIGRILALISLVTLRT